MRKLRSAYHVAGFLIAFCVASLAGVSLSAPSPPEQCFEHAGLKTLITIRLHFTTKDDLSGVFESSSNQDEETSIQRFAFTGHKESAAEPSAYRIAFKDNRRPEPLRKHRQIIWKLLPSKKGEHLLINLYGLQAPQREPKKPASSQFYDVELSPCAKTSDAAP